MSVQFQTFEGSRDDLIRVVSKQADLIIEGGSGANMWPFADFRKLGYSGPYVRMDLRYHTRHLNISNVYTTEGIALTDYWEYSGNCFRMEDMQPILKKFSPQNPIFVSNSALTNALFDPKELSHFEKKSPEDIIPIPEAVELLNKLYKFQLHISPAGFCGIASPEYERRHKKSVDGIPKVESYEGLVIYDVRGSTYGLDRFKTFVEESARTGWQFSLPTESLNVLYMIWTCGNQAKRK